MNALGLPILHDGIYPELTPEPSLHAPRKFDNQLQLLAQSIAFTDPLSGEPRHFESQLRLRALDGPLSGPFMQVAAPN
jgi:tRNA pseudouridine32 synthase/23S rRNA pseudouridine746 synthase